MDGIRKRLSRLFFISKGDPNNEIEEIEITKVQNYLLFCQKILSWEDIGLTLLVLIFLNITFCVTSILQVPIIGLLFLFILLGFLFDSIVNIEQLINIDNKQQRLKKLRTIHNTINDFLLGIRAFRKEKPSSFCACSTGFFVTLMIFAQKFNGVTFVYFTILGIFFIPLIIKQLSPETTSQIQQFITSLFSQRGVVLEEDLLPLPSERDDADSVTTDNTAESVTNSLISGLNSMPSHLEGEDKSLEEDDLLPASGYTTRGISLTPGDSSSDSDIENKEIKFDSTHFNTDSSSEEESLYPKNKLVDRDYLELLRDSVDANKSPTNLSEDSVLNNLINVASASSNLMVNAIKSAVVTATNQAITKDSKQRKNSSSDSEFEIINYDEDDADYQ